MLTAVLRKYIESSWYGQRATCWWLRPFAVLFALLTKLRRVLYTSHILRSPALPVPVIVVGNINVGGTGKTPVVAWLVQQLLAAGEQPGIVRRGYGGEQSKHPRLVVDGDAMRFGDEPVLLARTTGCPVCVCTDRVAAVQRLVREGVSIVVSDDGLQHYRMRRNAEIIVVDGERGFGNREMLPAGPLREPVSRVASAAALVVNGASKELQGRHFNLIPQNAVELSGTRNKSLSDFAGQTVLAVAGIGNPARFSSLLSGAGMQVEAVDVPDHGRVDLQKLRSADNRPIFLTEKDAVKYPDAGVSNVWYVPVRAEFSAADTEFLTQLALAVCQKTDAA